MTAAAMRVHIWRKCFSSPRRRWHFASICIFILLLNYMSTLVFKSAIKESSTASEKKSHDGENLAKTVSYNEILPDSVIDSGEAETFLKSYQDLDQDKSSTTIANEEVMSVTFPALDNPWYSEHSHDSKDPLGLKPDDFVYETIGECTIRQLKNVSIYSHAEFIHEYINYRRCFLKSDPDAGALDHWLKSHLKGSKGSRGEMIIKSSFELSHDINGLCHDHDPKVVVAVFSSSKRERDNIRSTWAKSLEKSYDVVFMLGQDSSEELDYEVNTYGDILQSTVSPNDPAFDFKQSIIMFSWIYRTCPLVRFVLKTTSDTFINTAKVDQLATQEMFAANRIYGELLQHMEPSRSPDQGHFISKEDWPWTHYPPFLKGPSMVVSGDVVPRLLMASTVIPTLPLAQVFFTGLVPLLGHIMRIGVASFFSYSPPPLETQDPCEFSRYGGIHSMTELRQMETALAKSEEAVLRNVTCAVGPRCLAMVEGKCMIFSKEEKKKRKKQQPQSRWP